ncbi:LmeA family phospholipid-binding protein [Streptomyces sp. SID1121]|uniref:LmeA family phospholipid-binding protein n=1 Tax=Streptomyces sp. SID1121 TaxID=3425888 RepID=UPI004057C30D
MSSPRHLLRRRIVVLAAAVAIGGALASPLIDSAVASHAERKIATAFQEATGTPQEPEVTVHGFPVLKQVARGRFDRVDIAAQGIPADSRRPLPISRLDVAMDGVTASADARAARARAASATAYVSYKDLSRTLGLDVGPATAPGRVQGSLLLPFGETVTVTATVKVGHGNAIAFENVKITGVSLPAGMRETLAGAFEHPVPLRNLPAGLHLTSLTTGQQGLEARFDGQNVAFQPSGEGA